MIENFSTNNVTKIENEKALAIASTPQGRPLNKSSLALIQRVKHQAIENLLQDSDSSGILETLWSYCPEATKAGRKIGWCAGQAYGSGISNATITMLCRYLRRDQERWYDNIINDGVSAVQLGLQMAITPHALPWITLATTWGGGMTLAGAALVCHWCYKKLSDNSNQPIETLPALEKLIQWDPKQKCLVDANGMPFTKEDLDDLFFLIGKIEFLEKLERSKDSEEAEKLIHEYVNQVKDKFQKNSSKLKTINGLAGRICGHNFRPEESEKAIDLIFTNLVRVDNSLACYRSQQLLKITKKFEHMRQILALPEVSSNDKYEYSENTGGLVKSGNRVYRKLYAITTASTAEAVKENIGKALDADYKKIKAQIEQMQEIDELDLKYIINQIEKTHESFEAFSNGVEKTIKGDQIQDEIKPLMNRYALEMAKLWEQLETRMPQLNTALITMN